VRAVAVPCTTPIKRSGIGRRDNDDDYDDDDVINNDDDAMYTENKLDAIFGNQNN
jgi:hypothetical protein